MGVQQGFVIAQHGSVYLQHGLIGSQQGLGVKLTIQIDVVVQGLQVGLQTLARISQHVFMTLTQQWFRKSWRSKMPASAEFAEMEVASATSEKTRLFMVFL